MGRAQFGGPCASARPAHRQSDGQQREYPETDFQPRPVDRHSGESDAQRHDRPPRGFAVVLYRRHNRHEVEHEDAARGQQREEGKHPRQSARRVANDEQAHDHGLHDHPPVGHAIPCRSGKQLGYLVALCHRIGAIRANQQQAVGATCHADEDAYCHQPACHRSEDSSQHIRHWRAGIRNLLPGHQQHQPQADQQVEYQHQGCPPDQRDGNIPSRIAYLVDRHTGRLETKEGEQRQRDSARDTVNLDWSWRNGLHRLGTEQEPCKRANHQQQRYQLDRNGCHLHPAGRARADQVDCGDEAQQDKGHEYARLGRRFIVDKICKDRAACDHQRRDGGKTRCPVREHREETRYFAGDPLDIVLDAFTRPIHQEPEGYGEAKRPRPAHQPANGHVPTQRCERGWLKVDSAANHRTDDKRHAHQRS